MVEPLVFIVAAAIILGGALGVVFLKNPVRAALSLVASFFGIAVLYVLQQANFLAVVQVVVYGGAVVVLFLFVIMLLGVDKVQSFSVEPIAGQKLSAFFVSACVLGLVLGGFFISGRGGEDGALALTGQQSVVAPLTHKRVSEVSSGTNTRFESDAELIAQDLFTRNALAFQSTALLLTIATIGAVVLVRNRGAEDLVVDEPGEAVR